MKKTFFVIFLFFGTKTVLAQDQIIISFNLVRGGLGGHIHFNLYKMNSGKIEKSFIFNVWNEKGIQGAKDRSTFSVLSEELMANKKKAFTFKGDYEDICQKWKKKWLSKIEKNKRNFWFNNCADDVLDTIAFIFGIKSKERRIWKVAKYFIPIVGLVPSLPELAFKSVSADLKRDERFQLIESKAYSEFVKLHMSKSSF